MKPLSRRPERAMRERLPLGSLDGPSRTIIVEPVEAPVPAPAPEADPPAPQPAPPAAPEPAPEPAT